MKGDCIVTTRYRIEVRGKRGEHDHYYYVAFEKVKPGKVQRLIDATARDIYDHEKMDLRTARFIDQPETDDGYSPVVVRDYQHNTEFSVYPTPVYEGNDDEQG